MSTDVLHEAVPVSGVAHSSAISPVREVDPVPTRVPAEVALEDVSPVRALVAIPRPMGGPDLVVRPPLLPTEETAALKVASAEAVVVVKRYSDAIV